MYVPVLVIVARKYPATYSYDETSGMYYDSATGLYYDPNTQVIICDVNVFSLALALHFTISHPSCPGLLTYVNVVHFFWCAVPLQQ